MDLKTEAKKLEADKKNISGELGLKKYNEAVVDHAIRHHDHVQAENKKESDTKIVEAALESGSFLNSRSRGRVSVCFPRTPWKE